MPTAARISISLCAAAALTVLWIAVFPSAGSADLVQPEKPAVFAASVQKLPTPKHIAAVTSASHKAEPKTAQVALVQVPNLTNLPVWVARKRAKNAGLAFEFFEYESKAKLPRSEYGFMRTDSQSVKAGTFVKPGTTLEFQTEDRFSFASGY